MKKTVMALIMLACISAFAGNPDIKNKIIRTTYNIAPEPPKPSPNGYLYDCCRSIVLGWDLTHTCYNVLIDCWGACSGHGWLVSTCTTGTIIRGAFLIPNKGTVKIDLPLVTGVLVDKIDTNLDPVSQVKEFTKIENSIINLENEMTLESNDELFVFAAGKYQIIDSKLMITVTIQP